MATEGIPYVREGSCFGWARQRVVQAKPASGSGGEGIEMSRVRSKRGQGQRKEWTWPGLDWMTEKRRARGNMMRSPVLSIYGVR